MVSEDAVREALTTVNDPEVGLNIVDLGLLEEVRIGDGRVEVDLIMTTPACPQGDYIVQESRYALLSALGTGTDVAVRIVDEPMWTPERISGDARQMMGWT